MVEAFCAIHLITPDIVIDILSLSSITETGGGDKYVLQLLS